MAVDGVSFFLSGATPLLTPAEEILLARQVQQGNHPDATRREQHLAKRAKQRFITANLKLVVSIAGKYRSQLNSIQGLTFDDILQEGCIGLNRAVEKFDPERGYKFSTYAYWWCRQSIARAIESNRSMIKMPAGVGLMLRRYRSRPEGQSKAAFCAEHDIKLKSLERELEQASRAHIGSLDVRLIDESGNHTLIDFVADVTPDWLANADVVKAVESLRECPEAMDHIALLELVEAHGKEEVAELLDMGSRATFKTLREAKQQLRQLVPTHVARELAVA